jgi:superfamily II DNA or RNA helicase
MSPSIAEMPNATAILGEARARIARELLDAHPTRLTIGEITLHPHQLRAVSRLKALLRFEDGAMLADATGLGKTFVALALAADFERTLIIAPASLLDTWRLAARRAGIAIQLTSMEMLSRGTTPTGDRYDLIVIDEAHHFRNPHTRRYGTAASLCDRTRVLLLSATPLQNRRDDLVAQLAIFLGDAALTASDAELARLIVRRRIADTALALPNVSGPHRLELSISDDLLDELAALPPSVPGSDEGEAGALLTYSLLRQWSSSRAALVGALRRRLAKATGLLSSLETGRWPTHDELLAWSCGSGAMQLAMPELFSTLGNAPQANLASMIAAVRTHADGLDALLARLRMMPNPDLSRAQLLAQIAAAHPDRRIIAFSQYAETVHELSRLLMTRRAGVAELTAHGGRIAGGRISRGEVLAQFAPAVGAGVPMRDRITMLVTTDVLSEGLDLQEASVVVHLDLPWNPARLEQRVGRVRRLGSRYEQVLEYVIAPPASSERVLDIETRLRAKLRIASEIVGIGLPEAEGAMRLVASTLSSAAPPELTSDVLAALEKWRGASLDGDFGARSTPLVAGVTAQDDGLLALLSLRGERVLLAAAGAEPSLDPALVAATVRLCDGAAATLSTAERASAIRLVQEWCEAWRSRRRLGLGSSFGARVRGRISARIAGLLSGTSRHEHASLTAIASRARRTLCMPLGAAGERALTELSEKPLTDVDWLRDVALLGERRDAPPRDDDAALLVLIVLRRD